MNKLIVALIAGAFASTAFAQAAMQTPADKAKQNEVSATTKAAAEGADVSSQKAGAAANKAKTEKGTPKALTTNEGKAGRRSSDDRSGLDEHGFRRRQRQRPPPRTSRKRATRRRCRPKQEKQKAVSATTKAGAEGADINAMKAGTQADKDKAKAAADKAAADKAKQ